MWEATSMPQIIPAEHKDEKYKLVKRGYKYKPHAVRGGSRGYT